MDVAQQAGVTAPNVWGGILEKKFIIETKGNGVAFFDYDRDGWADIYLSNGARWGGYPPGQVPTGHLYHNYRECGAGAAAFGGKGGSACKPDETSHSQEWQCYASATGLS